MNIETSDPMMEVTITRMTTDAGEDFGETASIMHLPGRETHKREVNGCARSVCRARLMRRSRPLDQGFGEKPTARQEDGRQVAARIYSVRNTRKASDIAAAPASIVASQPPRRKITGATDDPIAPPTNTVVMKIDVMRPRASGAIA